MTEVVGGEDDAADHIGCDRDRLAVDQQAVVHHIVHNDVKVFRAARKVELLDGDGQIQRVQEGHNLKQLFLRCVFQH